MTDRIWQTGLIVNINIEQAWLAQSDCLRMPQFQTQVAVVQNAFLIMQHSHWL